MTSGGPTDVMRMEHLEIAKQLEAIHSKVKVANPASDAEKQRLLSLLSLHNMKEENILYPAIDRLVTVDEVAKYLKKCSRFTKASTKTVAPRPYRDESIASLEAVSE